MAKEIATLPLKSAPTKVNRRRTKKDEPHLAVPLSHMYDLLERALNVDKFSKEIRELKIIESQRELTWIERFNLEFAEDHVWTIVQDNQKLLNQYRDREQQKKDQAA